MSRSAQTSKPHPLTKPPLPRTRGKKGDPRPARPADPKRDELRRWVAIDGHLARIRELLGGYQLDQRGHPKIFQLLARIEEHEREERLFLGVVGEFSSGKSTLLNALLRDDLLRTDIIQGTTAAATVLSYGPTLAVKVHKLPSHPVVGFFKVLWRVLTFPIALFRPRRPRDRDGLRALIHESSAVEEVARNVAQVNVAHPAESLKNGLVIIDLPGTNAENPRHGLVTATALTDFCDAAVIVIPVDVPASETLLGFLKDSLEADVLRRCVFVLNKIDKVRRQREREQLVQNLTARLRLHLGIEKPRVVEAAPERVLEAAGLLQTPIDPEFAMTPEENAHWITAFEKTEGILVAILQEQKLLLQVEQLARLLAQVFDTLAGVLKTRDAEFRDQHAALLEGLQQIPDLAQFVAQARARHCGAFAESVEPLLRSCGQALGKTQASTLRALAETIFATTNRKTLQEALEGPVRSIMSATQRSLQSTLRAAIRSLEQVAEGAHREFHQHFQTLFRNLATLGGRVRTETRGLDSGASKSFASGAGSAHVALAGNVAQLRQEEFLKTAGGAGLGAVMGSIVLPGLGTLVGGLLGGLFGRLFGPSHQEIAQRCWTQLEAAVQNGFEQFLNQAQANLERAVAEIEAGLATAIGRYADQYRRLVDEMMARDRQQAERLARFRDQIQRDLADIGKRQQHLDQARSQLRNQ